MRTAIKVARNKNKVKVTLNSNLGGAVKLISVLFIALMKNYEIGPETLMNAVLVNLEDMVNSAVVMHKKGEQYGRF